MGRGPCGLTPRLRLKGERMALTSVYAFSFANDEMKVKGLELKLV